MRDEVFQIDCDYNGQVHAITVKADLPIGPEPFGSDYDIYIGGKHWYTLTHCKNEDEMRCWEIRKRPKKDFDPAFAQAIGKAIDRHYS